MTKKEKKNLYIHMLHELVDECSLIEKVANHMREMIDKAFSGEKLSPFEAFECGKYYQRMMEQSSRGRRGEYLSAILEFKRTVCMDR